MFCLSNYIGTSSHVVVGIICVENKNPVCFAFAAGIHAAEAFDAATLRARGFHGVIDAVDKVRI